MRISGQRIVARLREAAYTNVLRQVRLHGTHNKTAADSCCSQDIGWHDLQGTVKTSPLSNTSPTAHQQAEHQSRQELAVAQQKTTSKDLAAKDTGVRSTGDIISRLGSDAGIVGDSLTRELSEGLR